MALFSGKDFCILCNEEKKVKQTIKDGPVCKECIEKVIGKGQLPSLLGGYFNKKTKDITKQEMLNRMDSRNLQQEELSKFNVTASAPQFFEIDEAQKKWLIPDGPMGKKNNPRIYNFDEIVEYELLEDDESITKGGIGRAVAGGALFGGAGAIVGGVTGKKTTKKVVKSLKIKITLNNMSNPYVYINFIDKEMKTSSFLYKTFAESAQKTLSLLSNIQKIVEADNNIIVEKEQPVNGSNSLEQIKTLKELLDMGAITEDEFNTKKKELLNI